MTNKEIAAEILTQLGGNTFRFMTGAKDVFAIDKGLQFDLPRDAHFVKDKINRIQVTLDDNDTYTVTAGRNTRRKHPEMGIMLPVYEEVSKTEGVYDTMLQSVFTDLTGLDTHL